MNEIVKAKEKKEVNKPNNFKDRLNNFQNPAQRPANKAKKVEPPKSPGISNMLTNYENQNNKEENKVKPHQPPKSLTFLFNSFSQFNQFSRRDAINRPLRQLTSF